MASKPNSAPLKRWLVIVQLSENMTSVPARFHEVVEAAGPGLAINKVWRTCTRVYDNPGRFPMIQFEVRLLS